MKIPAISRIYRSIVIKITSFLEHFLYIHRHHLQAALVRATGAQMLYFLPNDRYLFLTGRKEEQICCSRKGGTVHPLHLTDRGMGPLKLQKAALPA